MLKLEGSCYCKSVTFSAMSHTPYPYMRCYCSACRKSSGGGGYSINISAEADSLSIAGETYLGIMHSMEHDPKTDELIESEGRRLFCSRCGCHLWADDPRWPEWIYPCASAIDTPLPEPPEVVHIMLEFKVPWVKVPEGDGHQHFQRYPDESIIDWHQRHKCYIE
jgi:hypothetical protein